MATIILMRKFATTTLMSKFTKPQHTDAILTLKNGIKFDAKNYGTEVKKPLLGEIVFTTSQTGYVESMTDKSYTGQILAFSTPLIGNYGVPDTRKTDRFGLPLFGESFDIHASAIVVQDYALRYSHFNAIKSLAEWCKEQAVPLLSGVDIRRLIHAIRDGNSMASVGNGKCYQIEPQNQKNLVKGVSTKQSYHINPSGKYRVALLDFGAKVGILRELVNRNCAIHVYPWDTDLSTVLRYQSFDGIFLSNGPGDPAALEKPISNLRKTLEFLQVKNPKMPVFGICMGHQLLSHALGLQTYKLGYGNRGHNQPVQCNETKKLFITSQNHGYAVNIPENGTISHFGHVYPSFTNLNDGSNEGIKHVHYPWNSVQFHPEAASGPYDCKNYFDLFVRKAAVFKNFGQIARI
eukprot:NODE_100_length_20331_cov_1.214462.p5 type:complete len:406 gc:universal NODE_100_length_20331_cov_1.214462:13582-14799(+)